MTNLNERITELPEEAKARIADAPINIPVRYESAVGLLYDDTTIIASLPTKRPYDASMNEIGEFIATAINSHTTQQARIAELEAEVEAMSECLKFFDIEIIEGNYMFKPSAMDKFMKIQAVKEGRRQDCDNCWKCLEGVVCDLGIPVTSSRMILCPICGNKRCPKASDHKLACTNSNESGQPGSVYK